MNSETPAWLIDRMSILELKIYHMKEQTERTDTNESHINQCKSKLEILLEQRKDMSNCLSELLMDLNDGSKFMKVYRQMKMYNDKNLNPSLYGNEKNKMNLLVMRFSAMGMLHFWHRHSLRFLLIIRMCR